jgi:hypothetical protein
MPRRRFLGRAAALAAGLAGMLPGAAARAAAPARMTVANHASDVRGHAKVDASRAGHPADADALRESGRPDGVLLVHDPQRKTGHLLRDDPFV